jgi:hypothetical protein
VAYLYVYSWQIENTSGSDLNWDFTAYSGGGGGASEPVVEELPPSCESFNFVRTAGLWQVALVKNVRFKVFLLNEKGGGNITLG